MLQVDQFRIFIVQPVLTELAREIPSLAGEAAENLLVGTALIESNLSWLRQHGFGGNFSHGGLGLYQIEAATHDDCWNNFLGSHARTGLAGAMRSFAAPPGPCAPQLITNLAYATAIARLIYWRKPDPLPEADDIDGLGLYWKEHYNTSEGKGRASSFASRYRNYD